MAGRRQAVLFDDAEVVVEVLKAAPGVWHLIGAGTKDRASVFAQTAHRIRSAQYAAFVGGLWEARVSSAESEGRPEDEAVHLYARYMGTDLNVDAAADNHPELVVA